MNGTTSSEKTIDFTGSSPKLASRTFWLVVYLATSANAALALGMVPPTVWSGVMLGSLGIWVGGKWVAGKNGKTI